MRKLGKKMLSLALALALCLSIVPGHFITTAHAGGRGRVIVDEDGTIHWLGFRSQCITDLSGKTTEIECDDTGIIYGDGWSYSDEKLTLNGYRGRYIGGYISELVLADGSENYLSAMWLDGFALETLRISGSGTLTLEYNEEMLNPSDDLRPFRDVYNYYNTFYPWETCLSQVKSGTGMQNYSPLVSHCVIFDCYLGHDENVYPECKLEFADGLAMLGGEKKGDAQTVLMADRSELGKNAKLLMSETADGKPASYVRIAPQPSMSQQPTTPTQPANLAYASTQTVTVDGKPLELQTYALKDANGNDTNYVKLRDVAYALNGTAAQFSVGWNQASQSIAVTSGTAYVANGSEMKTPFSGNRAYKQSSSPLYIDGQTADLEAILLTDDAGSGYTYFKLRDLGQLLNFNVKWDGGVVIETDKPYTGK